MTPPRFTHDELQAAIEQDFNCARCGHCCKGDGLVRLTQGEVDRAANYLGLTRRQFTRQYAVRAPDKKDDKHWVLKDKLVGPPVRGSATKEKWCIFLELMPDGLYGCTINPAKPDQCASFPHKWRNDDSLQTCAGLRRLVAHLRKLAELETQG